MNCRLNYKSVPHFVFLPHIFFREIVKHFSFIRKFHPSFLRHSIMKLSVKLVSWFHIQYLSIKYFVISTATRVLREIVTNYLVWLTWHKQIPLLFPWICRMNWIIDIEDESFQPIEILPWNLEWCAKPPFQSFQFLVKHIYSEMNKRFKLFSLIHYVKK